jgi:two-component system LytT family sensor kinase
LLYSAYVKQPWRPQMAAALTDWYIWGLLAPAILALGRRFPLVRGRLSHTVPVLFVAGVVVTALKIVIRYEVGKLLPGIPTLQVRGLVLTQLHLNFATYWVILGIGAAFEYYGKYRERELRASQLESRLAQAQLDVLRMQLQPHFLFNTLHTISAFMQEGEIDAADRMISRLSDLLRLALDSVHTQEVPLRQEVEFLQRYLDIQQIRFQDQLHVAVDIADDTLDARVPSLILQPLVENAIKHGITPRAAGGHVSIRAHRDDGMLHVEVRDDGPGFAADAVDRGTGDQRVGLANTRARLEQLYGSRHRLTLRDAAEGGAVVELVLPFSR